MPDFRDWIVEQEYFGLACSQACPGNPIVLALDLAVSLRDAGVPIMSGFHTSVEQTCLDFLLGGEQPLTIVPARAPYRRIPSRLKPAIAAGRVTLLYPFTNGSSRQTSQLAEKRNRFVVERALALFVIYASPAGAVEEMARLAFEMGKPVLTFDVPENSRLLELGAIGLSAEEVRDGNSLRLRLESILR